MTTESPPPADQTAAPFGAADDRAQVQAPEPNDEPVPKLPRGRGLRLSGPELFRIAVTGAMLVAVVLLTKPCANAVSHFVTSFDKGSGAASAMPKPGNVDVPTKPAAGSSDQYERLRPGMTDDEVKAAIERAKAKAGPKQ